MAGISWVNLAEIQANPYQVRMAEDAEHVRNLAESIRARGLMQYPVARRIDGENEGDAVECWQLAFGHSRLAAYKLLYAEDPQKWMQMPLIIQGLTDEEMFEYAVQENLDRKDLTPVELARAMTVYREKFGKTSGEIGALFHLSDSAVRNKMRLLDLPEDIQARVGAGISEGVARKILSVQGALPAEKTTALVEAIQEKGLETPESVNQEIERTLTEEKAVMMWGSYQTLRQGDKMPRGGTGLWQLDWEPNVPGVYISDLMKQLTRWKDTSWFGKRLVEEIAQLMVEEGCNAQDILRRSTWPAGMPERFVNELEALCKKPKCSDCLLHIRIESKHYCMFKACWKQRKDWWCQAELERLSGEMGIAIYDKETDGDKTLEAGKSVYYKGQYMSFPWREWIEKGQLAHLRLKADYQEYDKHAYTENHCVVLVGIAQGPLEKVLRSHKEMLAEAEREKADYQRESIDRLKRVEATQRFLNEEGAAAFAQMLAPLTKPGVLLWLAREVFKVQMDDLAKAAETARKEPQVFHRLMVREWLRTAVAWEERERGPAAIAHLMAGWAAEMGIILPEDWKERARRYDPSPLTPRPEGEDVSVETII